MDEITGMCRARDADSCSLLGDISAFNKKSNCEVCKDKKGDPQKCKLFNGQPGDSTGCAWNGTWQRTKTAAANFAEKMKAMMALSGTSGKNAGKMMQQTKDDNFDGSPGKQVSRPKGCVPRYTGPCAGFQQMFYFTPRMKKFWAKGCRLEYPMVEPGTPVIREGKVMHESPRESAFDRLEVDHVDPSNVEMRIMHMTSRRIKRGWKLIQSTKSNLQY